MAARETAAGNLPGDGPESKPKKRRKRAKKPAADKPALPASFWQRLPWKPALLIGTELCALAGVSLVATIAALGRAADWFGGSGFAANLLPFAAMVLMLGLAGSGLMWLWLWLRVRLRAKAAHFPASLALCLAIAVGVFAAREPFKRELANLRGLVGGSQEAERAAIAHQVYAAYRRSDLGQMRRILDRAQPYLPAIRDAASAYEIDAEILVGIGAAESSFVPRDSKDGGRGLFQITAAPKAALAAVKQRLGTAKPDPLNPAHNAHLAAATLRHYLREMRGDLFLGLLAYNIGPRNGGLRSVMSQYGARDFVTIQPYLQHLPRDYPVRVLSAALAFRLWRTDGKLPRYEEGDNAQRIQEVGIPGLGDDEFHSSRALAGPIPPA
jgi:hypothetical protein